MNTPRKLISVVVPCFNEELNLINFYKALTDTADNQPYDIEIILVNDGSKDETYEVIKQLNFQDPRVRGINFSRNFGSYAAIEAGMRIAKGDAIMCISADLQDPPSIIEKFVPLWEDGNHIVWGVRAGRDDPFFKNLFALLFYRFVRLAAFPDFPKEGMDIGLFDRTVIDEYLKIGERNSIPFFTIYSLGYKQAQVPYRRAERVAGESGWPFWKRVKCAIDIAVQFSYVPIRLITGMGFAFAGIAFVYAIVILCLKLFSNATSTGWSSLAVLILFIGGIQMIFLGVLAEYLWRTNDRVKNRPSYLIMERTPESELSNPV